MGSVVNGFWVAVCWFIISIKTNRSQHIRTDISPLIPHILLPVVNLLPTSPTMHLSHWVTSLEAVTQMTGSFFCQPPLWSASHDLSEGRVRFKGSVRKMEILKFKMMFSFVSDHLKLRLMCLCYLRMMVVSRSSSSESLFLQSSRQEVDLKMEHLKQEI